MKRAYPVMISEENDGYHVTIPDFDIATQVKDFVEAICTARNAIGLIVIDLMDNGKEIPEPNSVKIKKTAADIVTYVDVDFSEYRAKIENRAVKKNCTIPYWMNAEAEKMGVNFSKVLQDALEPMIKTKKTKS